jgi:hypothetical protein
MARLLTWHTADLACPACRYLGPDYSDPDKRGVVGTITGEWCV